ncbi:MULTISPECIES: tyrosine-type recombinase/integrase [Pseudomonadaceae]|jgi:integrase|uniref:tyrosine-type recombinase/integrase n=1 Tax=Pseudomonadaceae TaxID=135621 RepID=UPI000DB6737F|nr:MULTISPECIES: tyrosine-type recombinase/integrase [Pseudomonas]MBA4689588.1 tyrosine-type recombinase/integrase [Pseudomonas sp.]MBA6123102.1 tyrosine-type recombinase/integrase [Pseudomonas juntendi]PZR34181.1 MAG: hypothetical protein DI538_16990 [Azospira oryzae]RCL64169.1 MAG: hypothetical protein DBW88_03125 [Pseudomonas sp.]
MPVIWPAGETRRTVIDVLTKNGLDSVADVIRSLPSSSAASIPLIISPSGELVREISEFIYERWLYSGAEKSKRTLSTYAESLSDWLTFTEAKNISWKVANKRSIAKYRSWLKGSDNSDRTKALASRTINLRVTAVVEFYKYYWGVNISSESVSAEISKKWLGEIKNQKSLRVNVNKPKPRSISNRDCNRFISELPCHHGLIFLWTVCTGLRVGSVLSLTIDEFERLIAGGDGFIEVKVKGGKILDTYIPRRVVIETQKYISTHRVLASKTMRQESCRELFLNSRGLPVSRHCYYRAFKTVCGKFGIKANPHQARATFASRVEEKLHYATKELGIDSLKVIQGLLGHVSSSTTQDYLDRLALRSPCIMSLLDESSKEVGEANV